MWTIIKIDKKKLNIFKEDLTKKLGSNFQFYCPKLIVQKYKNNKLIKKEFNLLGDYMLCYHNDFNNPQTINKLKFIRGLKYFLNGFLQSQEEIQNFICSEIKSSVRELVGALNRIISFSRIYSRVPSLSEIRIILKDLLNIYENKVTIDIIQTIVCKDFKISKNEMLSPRRSRYLVRPRQTAIYLSKMLTSKSLPEIGRCFSNRDHTTVIHSVKTIEKLRKENNELNIKIDNLKNKILYNKNDEI